MPQAMPEPTTEAEFRESISFHLSWAEVDPDVHPSLANLAPKRRWLQMERAGATKGLFLHTVHAGTHTLNTAFMRDLMLHARRREVVAQGLDALALCPPYDNLPLYAGVLTQTAFNAQMRQSAPVTMDDLPLRPDQVAPEHFLASIEASFGFTLAVLRAYSYGWNRDD